MEVVYCPDKSFMFCHLLCRCCSCPLILTGVDACPPTSYGLLSKQQVSTQSVGN